MRHCIFEVREIEVERPVEHVAVDGGDIEEAEEFVHLSVSPTATEALCRYVVDGRCRCGGDRPFKPTVVDQSEKFRGSVRSVTEAPFSEPISDRTRGVSFELDLPDLLE